MMAETIFQPGDRVRVTTTVYGNFLPNPEGYCVSATKGSTGEYLDSAADDLVWVRFTYVAPFDPLEAADHEGTPYMVCERGKVQTIDTMYLEKIT
jgi:hypothetical protein